VDAEQTRRVSGGLLSFLYELDDFEALLWLEFRWPTADSAFFARGI